MVKILLPKTFNSLSRFCLLEQAHRADRRSPIDKIYKKVQN